MFARPTQRRCSRAQQADPEKRGTPVSVQCMPGIVVPSGHPLSGVLHTQTHTHSSGPQGMLGTLALPGRFRTSSSGNPLGCPKTPPSQESPRPYEDGDDSGPAFLRRLRWNLPQLLGRSGSLTRTGKRCGGKRPVSASSRLRRLIASPLAAGSRVTASCCSRCCSTRRSASASWYCASSSGCTSSWSAAPCLTASSAGAD